MDSAPSRRPRTGFTFTELVVALVVFGLLASVTALSYDTLIARSQDSALAADASYFELTYRNTIAFDSLDGPVDAIATEADRVSRVMDRFTSSSELTYVPALGAQPGKVNFARSGRNVCLTLSDDSGVKGTIEQGICPELEPVEPPLDTTTTTTEPPVTTTEPPVTTTEPPAPTTTTTPPPSGPPTPDAPGSLTATLDSDTPTTVSVSFTPGSGNPTSFEITCVSSGSGVTRSATGASSPISVSSLTAGEPYTCTATATDPEASPTTSPASAPTSSFTPYNPALAPTGLSASNVDTDSLTMNWTPLTSTDARPVSGYRVYIGASTTPACTAIGASTSSCPVTGLEEDTSYSFRVRAYHLATLGAASSPLSVTTDRTPDPISSASVTTPAISAYTWYCPTGGVTDLRTSVAGFCSTNTTITRNLDWSVVVDASAVNSGSATLVATVFRTSNNTAVSGKTTTVTRSTSGTATGTFTGLETSTSYYVRVSVTDDAGRQLTLNSASVTTPAVESNYFTDPTTVSVTTAWRNAADASTAEDYVLRHSTASTGGGAGNAYDSNWSTLFQINNMTESFPFAAATGIDVYSGWSYVNSQTCTASTKNACYVAADASSEGWIHTSLDVDIVGARFRNPARFNTYFYFRDTVANAWRIPAGVTTGTLVVPSIYTACSCSVPSLDGTTWATRVLGSAGYAIDSNWTTMDVGASGITNMSINTNIFGMRGIQWRFYVLARKTTAGSVVQVADTQIQLRLTYSERRLRQR